MFRQCGRRAVGAVVLATAGALSWCAPATAEEADMESLPVTQPFACLACHVNESPSTFAEAALNPFGEDYLDNGRFWDQALAYLDSDGDGCTNGAEIGDVDGDGEADGNVELQAGNPGVSDNCDSGPLVEEQTWSALKAIFDGR